MRVLSVVHQEDAGLGVFERVLAECGHELELWRPAAAEAAPGDLTRYDAALVLGGAMHVDEEARHPWLTAEKALLRTAVGQALPTLGVCLGAQLLAEAADGGAVRADRPEIGWHAVELASAAGADPLLASLPVRFTAFAWHSYEIVPPPGAETLARSSCCLQAFRRRERAWGIQFHAEVTLDTVGAWVEKDAEDAELRRAGIDPARLLEETEDRIARSNAVGETLCAGFLDLVADGVG